MRDASGAPEAARTDVPLTLETTYDFEDGCTWQAVETLVPIGNGEFRYQYREHMVSCDEDAIPAMACERGGVVSAVPLD